MSAKKPKTPTKKVEPEPDVEEDPIEDDEDEDILDDAEDAADKKKSRTVDVNAWEADARNAVFSHKPDTGKLQFQYKHKGVLGDPIFVNPPGIVLFENTGGVGHKFKKQDGDAEGKDSEYKYGVTVTNRPIDPKIDRILQRGTKKVQPFNTHAAWDKACAFYSELKNAAVNYIRDTRGAEEKFKAAQKVNAQKLINKKVVDRELVYTSDDAGLAKKKKDMRKQYESNLWMNYNFPFAQDGPASEEAHTWFGEEPCKYPVYNLKASTHVFMDISDKFKKFYKLDPRVKEELEKDPKNEDLLYILAEDAKKRSFNPLIWYNPDNTPQKRGVLDPRTTIGNTVSMRSKCSPFQYQSNAGMLFLLMPSINMNEVPRQAFKKDDFKSDFSGINDEIAEEEQEALRQKEAEGGEDDDDAQDKPDDQGPSGFGNLGTDDGEDDDNESQHSGQSNLERHSKKRAAAGDGSEKAHKKTK